MLVTGGWRTGVDEPEVKIWRWRTGGENGRGRTGGGERAVENGRWTTAVENGRWRTGGGERAVGKGRSRNGGGERADEKRSGKVGCEKMSVSTVLVKTIGTKTRSDTHILERTTKTMLASRYPDSQIT